MNESFALWNFKYKDLYIVIKLAWVYEARFATNPWSNKKRRVSIDCQEFRITYYQEEGIVLEYVVWRDNLHISATPPFYVSIYLNMIFKWSLNINWFSKIYHWQEKFIKLKWKRFKKQWLWDSNKKRTLREVSVAARH